jgi:hypothetical protein
MAGAARAYTTARGLLKQPDKQSSLGTSGNFVVGSESIFYEFLRAESRLEIYVMLPRSKSARFRAVQRHRRFSSQKL